MDVACCSESKHYLIFNKSCNYKFYINTCENEEEKLAYRLLLGLRRHQRRRGLGPQQIRVMVYYLFFWWWRGTFQTGRRVIVYWRVNWRRRETLQQRGRGMNYQRFNWWWRGTLQQRRSRLDYQRFNWHEEAIINSGEEERIIQGSTTKEE